MPIKFWSIKLRVHKSFGQTKVWSKRNLAKKTKVPISLGPKSLVKIGSVTAEIFLIWTIVARTTVAWTNVNMTVGICSRGFQESIISWIEVESN